MPSVWILRSLSLLLSAVALCCCFMMLYFLRKERSKSEVVRKIFVSLLKLCVVWESWNCWNYWYWRRGIPTEIQSLRNSSNVYYCVVLKYVV
jgi:hypothetical protein